MSDHVVLVVDADPAVTDELAARMSAPDRSVTVRSAATAAAAEEAVADTAVDCVVSEHVLGDRDGVGLLRRLGDGYPDLVRILFTDAGSEEVASDAVEAGVDAYVPKQLGASGPVDVRATDEAYERVATTVADALERTDSSRVAPDSTAAKIDTLHDVAMDLEACTDEAEIYQVAVEAAEMVLEFDMSNIDLVEDERLTPVQTSSEMPKDGVESVPLDGESVAARVARTGEAMYTEDLRQVLDADPTQMTYRSGLTVPISDIGVFQAISEELAAFDQADLELAETLMQHVAESVKRTRFQRTLREERDRFAALFENVPDPVVRLSTGDRRTIDAVNEAFAETFDCDAARVVDTPIDEVLFAPPNAGGDAVFPGVAAADEVAPTELRLQAADGPRDFLVHVVPIGGAVGEDDTEEVYGFYADITPTKERKRELARQNERLDEFASIVSHDLRNPLNIAEGHLQLAIERIGDDEDLAEVAWAHGRMRELIENLLSLARTGSVVDEPGELSLSATADQAWSSVRLPEARLAVDDDVHLRADRGRLTDLFVNLFRNAVEHGRTDATVRIGPLDDATGFFVADDGPGIPPEAHEQVFESGYTTSDDGTGFGLAIVEQVATAHGWTVSVTSSTDGGARFEFVTDAGTGPLGHEQPLSVEAADED
ncbi:hybrid sensor histidine kinase/response regulator [Haloarchaeobius salinus]|uniref:hybrid sensor histidine kinase/response regulator n=1 Tax=Haloarchaeobius salinus TaxID=1198298 RepID=UPI00210ACC33|nr:ATP-binding protein [Haloarchaeobius salinus]